MKLYDENGYLNIQSILDQGLPFNFIVGGRGTGKTYGALKYVKEKGLKFVFMRRMQNQVDIIGKPEFSPFKTLNSDMGWNVYTAPITKYNAGFYDFELIDDKLRPVGPPIGYIAALSTISNLRGFDASDVDVIIYDEFIPERHERPIKEEGSAFLNAYETINRNRELSGRKPVQLLALANANAMGNPIFLELKLVNKAENMRRTGQEVSVNKNKGIGLFMLNGSPISEQKKDTALYRITSGTDFSEMALDNNFAEMNTRSIKSMPLQEFVPVVNIGEITVYRHKSKKLYYVSQHNIKTEEFGTSDIERKRFLRGYLYLWEAYMKNIVVFENASCEIYFNKYFE